MNLRFKILSRAAGVSTAIALFASTIASAQSFDTASGATAAVRALPMSRVAFDPSTSATQPSPATTSDSAVRTKPSLLRQARATVARLSQAAPAKTSQQKSWASRHKAVTALIVVGAIFGGTMLAVGVATNWGDD